MYTLLIDGDSLLDGAIDTKTDLRSGKRFCADLVDEQSAQLSCCASIINRLHQEIVQLLKTPKGTLGSGLAFCLGKRQDLTPAPAPAGALGLFSVMQMLEGGSPGRAAKRSS